jgi:hypothetical protein
MDNTRSFDEFKRIAIIAVFSDDVLLEELVLKGGNAIDIAYGAASRASVDLDFSMGDDFEPVESLRARLTSCLQKAFLEHGLVAFDIRMIEVPPGITDDMKDFWGGYRAEFKLIPKAACDKHGARLEDVRRNALPLHANGSTKFCIDISKHELRDDKVTTDLGGFTVPVYSPRMIVCEKLRAICQQLEEYAPIVRRNARPGSARARDFFDIYGVTEGWNVNFEEPEFKRLLQATFEAKRVPLRFIGLIPGAREFHRPDFVSVKDTVRPGVEVKDFDFYFDYVVDKCRVLEALWKE